MSAGSDAWLARWQSGQEELGSNDTVVLQNDSKYRLGIYGIFAIIKALATVGTNLTTSFAGLNASKTYHTSILMKVGFHNEFNL